MQLPEERLLEAVGDARDPQSAGDRLFVELLHRPLDHPVLLDRRHAVHRAVPGDRLAALSHDAGHHLHASSRSARYRCTPLLTRASLHTKARKLTPHRPTPSGSEAPRQPIPHPPRDIPGRRAQSLPTTATGVLPLSDRLFFFDGCVESPRLWMKDEILGTYKFSNVYRASDDAAFIYREFTVAKRCQLCILFACMVDRKPLLPCKFRATSEPRVVGSSPTECTSL
jgi:hypothetical protein